MTSNENNKDLINSFNAMPLGRGLEDYLKLCAWNEDLNGETSVYLIKDKKNKIVAYFSLKCGLLYKPKGYAEVDQEDKDLITNIFDALKNGKKNFAKDFYESYKVVYGKDRATMLYNKAKEQFFDKKESSSDKTLAVEKSYSAIELSHFCKNINYKWEESIPVGMGFFWELITPMILKITKSIGSKYVYLFAADNTIINNEKNKVRKLLRYYSVNLKFKDLEELTVIQPDYDRGCYPLFQAIDSLKENYKRIWSEFVN